MDHCERYIILYATKLLEISLNFIDANCEKKKIRRGLQCLRERELLHFREAENTGGEERVPGRGDEVPGRLDRVPGRGMGRSTWERVRIHGRRVGVPDRIDRVHGKIG